MSGLAHHDPSQVRRAAPRNRREPPDRLWSSLARPVIRRQPVRGFDVAGDYIAGVFARRISLSRLFARARAISAAAAALSSHSDSAFDDLVADAARAIARRRDEPHAIDAVFSVTTEAVRRTLGFTFHVEQIVGGLAMARGCCAEMATGEGKTITAILPAALDAFAASRRAGVHVLTVNDYLARRDAQITAPAYQRLGLSVAFIQDDTPAPERRSAYSQDVLYAADKQVIFDHLRDRLVSPVRPSLPSHLLDQLAATPGPVPEPRRDWSRMVVQRGLHAAIADEADSILIDEAVTPAIIAQPLSADQPWGGEDHFRTAASIARRLTRDSDYTADTRLRRIDLTEAGRRSLDLQAQSLPPFWSGPRRREELIIQALTAAEFYHKGDDYIIRDDKIVIVDRSTGRVLEGRQWQLGLHQAVEAREGLPITGINATSAKTSYQRFFQRYARLCGMTGTAREVRNELWRDYRLPVLRIPTHKPCIRKHLPDRVFPDKAAKFAAAADAVASFHASRRPVLVGTRSIKDSETLGALLAQRHIHCRILNATREAEEAQIVALAGLPASVTVATNMAGRGTDIILTPETRELGGLFVLATERHDERRVDRQLFGRAGRQGDPGAAQAFVSYDDPLIQVSAIASLRWLARRLPPPFKSTIDRLLWWSAQRIAGHSAATLRREIARRDAMFELAMHTESR